MRVPSLHEEAHSPTDSRPDNGKQYVGSTAEIGGVLRGGRRAVSPSVIESLLPPGRLNGRRIAEEDLKIIEQYLKSKGVGVTYDPSKPIKHGVNPTTGKSSINLRKDSTWYEFLHEYAHELHYRRIGMSVDEWRRLTPYEREAEVFKYLLKNFWDAMTLEERNHAIDYLLRAARAEGREAEATQLYKPSDLIRPYPSQSGNPSIIRLIPPESP